MTVYSVLRRYLRHGFWPFFRALVRFCTAPITHIAAYIPEQGYTIDVGCGQGHFLAYCRLGGFQHLAGVEPSSRATHRARSILPSDTAVIRGDASALPLKKCRALVAIDVLYLMSPDDQVSFIRDAASILEPGGMVLVKTMDPTQRFRQMFNVIQEILAVRLLRITMGSAFSFRTPEEWIEVMEQHGLEAHSIPLWKWFIHPHVLIVGRRIR